MKFNLGDLLKDRVSGFTGIAIARVEYLNGCVQYCVKPQALKDGAPIEALYFDDSQLELKKAGALRITVRQTGGPSTERLPRL